MGDRVLCAFFKLHITAQPGPVQSSNAIVMDLPYGGSVVGTAKTTSNKPRQRGHAIATLSLATATSISSTSSMLSLHRSVCCTAPLAMPSPFSLLSRPLMLSPLLYIFLVWDSRPAAVGQGCRPLPPAPVSGPWSYYYSLVKLG